MLNIQTYKKVESLDEAYELNKKKANRIIGGMMWMRMGETRIQTAIDLSGLGLDTIEENQQEFKIGCMTTLRQLEQHEGFNKYTCNMAKESLRHIVGVQFRNMATVGGSIYGRYGFSDVLTLFLALDTYVELYKGGIVPLEEFAGSAYDNDIIVAIIVKKHDVNVFYEAVRITQTDLPVLTCCAARDLKDNSCNVVIGARPGRALRVKDTHNILSKIVSRNDNISNDIVCNKDEKENIENNTSADIDINERIDKFAKYAKETVPTQSNMRGSAEYRSHLTEVLVKRALEQLFINKD